MSEAFYPFVDNGEGTEGDTTADERYADAKAGRLGTLVRSPARIAVVDDPAAAPRVEVVEPSDIRTYLEQVTTTTYRLAREQGGRIPGSIIREVVENLVHAYFSEPIVSILDEGNTIRFSDQGPGIPEKDKALEYGTTSATSQMKRYIRGVGSGLPQVQQYMDDHGGTLEIEDNISGGTVVTLSLAARAAGPQAAQDQAQAPSMTHGVAGAAMPERAGTPAVAGAVGAWVPPSGATMPGGYSQPTGASRPAGYPQPATGTATPAGYAQAAATYPQPYYPPQPYAPWPQPWPQGAPYPQPQAAQQPSLQPKVPAELVISQRGHQVLEWLRTHESVGPKDLVGTYGGSMATWTRQLQDLERKGLVRKEGQKHFITEAGRSLLA